jgi:putative transcriptional regulator
MMHPPTETLVAHASGHLDPALRVVIEAHLDLCSTCRAELAASAAPGGWLLARGVAPTGASAESSADPLWERLEARLGEAWAPAPVPASVPLPAAARLELEPGARRLRWWSPMLRGARIAILQEDPATGTSLALAHMPGGRVFPRHRHTGFEHAVVLAGGYEDEKGSFTAGDFAIYEPGSEHGPHTLDGDDCWILFRLGGPVRFEGWRGTLQRLFS